MSTFPPKSGTVPLPTGLPLISVVIPCYNHAHFLEEAIESVLAQDYPKVEVMVVDDGSTDNTAEVTRKYDEVRYFGQKNKGLSAARNSGLRHTSGNYLVFLDADDRLRPGALTTGANHLFTSPNLAFVAGGLRVIDKEGEPIEKEHIPAQDVTDHYRYLLTGNHIWTPATAIFRRKPLAAAGGFDESLSPCADYDVYLKVARHHRVSLHPQLVAEYRQYPQSMSGNAAWMFITAMAVMRRQLPHVENSPPHLKAYEEGLNHWKEVYGPLISAQIKEHIKTPGELLHGLRKAGILFWYAPMWTTRHATNKAKSFLRNAPKNTGAPQRA